jgi:hypothetical protein
MLQIRKVNKLMELDSGRRNWIRILKKLMSEVRFRPITVIIFAFVVGPS